MCRHHQATTRYRILGPCAPLPEVARPEKIPFVVGSRWRESEQFRQLVRGHRVVRHADTEDEFRVTAAVNFFHHCEIPSVSILYLDGGPTCVGTPVPPLPMT